MQQSVKPSTDTQAQAVRAASESAPSMPARLARVVAISLGHFCVVAVLYAFFLSWQQSRAFPDVLAQLTVGTPGSGTMFAPALFVVVALGGLVDYMCMLAHESGHVLTALVLRSWFLSCRVGMLTLTRTRGGLRLGISPNRAVGGAVVSYLTGERGLLLRDALVAFGGPLASLLFAVPLWWLAGHVWPQGGGEAAMFPPGSLLGFVAGYSMLNCVGNLLPYKSRSGQISDGLRMLQPLLRRARARRDAALSVLMGCLLRRIPVSDWPPAIVQQALRFFDDGSVDDELAAILAYAWASNARDIPAARWYLYRALAPSPGRAPYLPGLALEAAYFIARHDRQPSVARTWLAHGAGAQYEAVMRTRAEAAILLAEGRLSEARACAAAGLAAVAHARPSSLVSLDEEERDLREVQALAPAGPLLAADMHGADGFERTGL